MHARWRFRLVRTDRSGSYWTENWRVLELIGSDAEALAMAWDIVAPIVHEVAHIQAVSVGRPSEITDTPGRLLIFVHARLDGRGWDLHGDMMHDCWQVSLVQAVDYVASRNAGYTSETCCSNAWAALWRHERPHRQAATPEFWVRLPELPAHGDADALKRCLGKSGRVYAPYVLLRSMRLTAQQL